MLSFRNQKKIKEEKIQEKIKERIAGNKNTPEDLVQRKSKLPFVIGIPVGAVVLIGSVMAVIYFNKSGHVNAPQTESSKAVIEYQSETSGIAERAKGIAETTMDIIEETTGIAEPEMGVTETGRKADIEQTESTDQKKANLIRGGDQFT